MSTVDSAILTQIQNGEIRPFVLVYFDVGSGFRFTDCDVDIWTGGNQYTPRNMQPGNFSYSTGRIVDQATISVDNTDDLLTSSFVGSVVQSSAVLISGVWLDSDYAIIGSPVTLFEGEIDDWRLYEGYLEITISNQFSQWNRRTFNQHSSSCRWKVFKGTQCGYAGAETWCDRSYARCVALSNQARFGGFPYLPSIERANIWWGKAPAKSTSPEIDAAVAKLRAGRQY